MQLAILKVANANIRAIEEEVVSIISERNLHILIVDDDAEMCSLLNDHLTNKGHDVESYTNPVDGLFRIQLAMTSGVKDDRPIDLVICDIRMPGIDGNQFAERSQFFQPQLPLVLMSGHALPEAISQTKGNGVQGFLSKPFSLADIDSQIALVKQGDAA